MVAPVPGRAEVVRYATADKLDRVARECSEIAGRRMRVRFETAPGAAGEASDPAVERSGSGPPTASRRAAMELPLVREAFEVFPDAMLIDVRTEPTD